jgi:hypothetical protein
VFLIYWYTSQYYKGVIFEYSCKLWCTILVDGLDECFIEFTIDYGDTMIKYICENKNKIIT